MMQTPYYIHYSPPRMMVHKMVTSKYFDLAISAVIGLNVITMAMEFYMMPRVSTTSLHEYIFVYTVHFQASILTSKLPLESRQTTIFF